jgi:hypothetical protein
MTPADVKDGFPTTVPDAEIQLLIDILDEADACLDANNVSEDRRKILKLYAVRHMLTMQANAGRGTVTSESAPSGASRSYSAWRGIGVNASPYGSMLKQLDKHGCVVSLLENSQRLGVWSVG